MKHPKSHAVLPLVRHWDFAERDINERACAYSLILDHRTSLEHPLGEAVDVLLTREAAERFIAEVRSDEGELERLAPLT